MSVIVMCDGCNLVMAGGESCANVVSNAGSTLHVCFDCLAAVKALLASRPKIGAKP